LVLEKDFFNPDWYSFLSFDQPSLPKYIFGAALQLRNGTLVKSSDGVQHFHYNLFHRILCPNLKPDYNANIDHLLNYCTSAILNLKAHHQTNFNNEHLKTMRLTSFAFTAGTLVVLLILCYQLTSSLASSFAGGILFLNGPILTPYYRIAFTDPMWTFFIICGLLVLFRLIKSLDKGIKTIFFWGSLHGLILSLALSTKLIVIPSLVATTLALAIVFFLRRKNGLPSKSILWAVGSSFSSGILGFIILNPFLYKDTISNLLGMIEHRSLVMQIQAIAHMRQVDMSTFSGKLERIFDLGFLFNFGWRGIYSKLGILLLISILVTGMNLLSKSALKSLRLKTMTESLSIFIWIVGVCTITTIKIPTDFFPRYFLFYNISAVLLFSFGVSPIFSKLGTLEKVFKS
jgi:hypothetical protein